MYTCECNVCWKIVKHFSTIISNYLHIDCKLISIYLAVIIIYLMSISITASDTVGS